MPEDTLYPREKENGERPRRPRVYRMFTLRCASCREGCTVGRCIERLCPCNERKCRICGCGPQ